MAVTANKSKRYIDSKDFITVPQITMRTVASKTGSQERTTDYYH